jgi:hypothetical protein
MNNILDQLRSHHSNPGKISAGIHELHGKIVVDSEGDKEKHNALCFDFLMEDGISLLTAAIRSDKVSPERVKQGFDVLFQVSEENACHWQDVWLSFGKLDGIILFLENHSSVKSSFARALDLCSRLSQFRLLQAEAEDTVRWLPFWGLLLEGVETFYEADERIFCSFCNLLDNQKDKWIPLEIYGRISLLLTRGIQSERTNVARSASSVNTCRTRIYEWFVVDETSRGWVRRIDAHERSWITKMYMFIPCSAAA